MKKRINLPGVFSALIAVLLLSSCNKNVVYSKYVNFPNSEWKSSNKAVFEPEISDTVSLNNITFMVRHAESYPFRNVIVFVKSTYPDGKVTRDTMNIMLANSKGEWQGSGAGDIFDLSVPAKNNVRFPLKGKYQFEFEHGMREDPLPMMLDFGLEIRKSN